MSYVDVSLRHSAPSPALRDKIRLFEGRGCTPQLAQHPPNGMHRTVSSVELRSSSSYRGTRLSPSRSLTQSDRGESSRRLHSPIPSTSPAPTLTTISTSTTTVTTHEVPSIPILRGISASSPEVSTISPRKWNVITLDPEHHLTTITTASHQPTTTTTASTIPTASRDKGKEPAVLSLDYDGEAVDSGEESSPKIQLPTLAKSPRRTYERKYEEEVIKLKKMTSEEKEMIKAFIKLTTRKVCTSSDYTLHLLSPNIKIIQLTK
jgi:hypothetical protein